jgi:hypothetical protein
MPSSCNGAATGARDRLEREYSARMDERLDLGRLVSYVGNKSTPILRLFRYKEAFAFDFVRLLLKHFALGPGDLLLDPFCGMGTALFAAATEGIPSVGIDRLPVAAFVARTLGNLVDVRPGEIASTHAWLRARVDDAEPASIADDVRIIPLAFSPANLRRLRQWKTVIGRLEQPLRDVFLLLLYAVLEPTSYTSKDGQFLRLDRSRRPVAPDKALERKCSEAEQDLSVLHDGMRYDAQILRRNRPQVLDGDTCAPDSLHLPRPASAIITSPPYVNRYDYTRSYCLELCFGFVRDFAQLRDLRHALLRSHIESRVGADEEPAHEAVAEVVESLRRRHLNNPRIPLMVTGYFADLERALRQWADWVAPGARVAMVVDNVRFQGEHVPVDLILSDIARRYGFMTEEIWVARYKGNSSQQMGRYGRLPVRESIVMWRKN